MNNHASTNHAAEQALIWRGITPPKVYSRKTTCPQCSHKRTKRDQPCLSVYVDDDRVSWQCWHCEWQGEEYL